MLLWQVPVTVIGFIALLYGISWLVERPDRKTTETFKVTLDTIPQDYLSDILGELETIRTILEDIRDHEKS